MKKIIFFLIIFTVFISCSLYKNKITASGTIEINETNVSSKTADEVNRLLVNEGDEVKEGDVIATIKHTTLDLQLKQAESAMLISKYQSDLVLKGARSEDINMADENLNQAKTNLDSSETDLKRMKDLFEKGDISKKQIEDAQTKYDINKTQYNTALINLNKLKKGAREEEINVALSGYNQAKANYDIIKQKIEECNIKSPANGIITNKLVEEGEFVNVGTPIYTVSKVNPVNLTIYVNETELGKIKIGMETKVKIDSFPKRFFIGKIIYISPNAEFTPKNIQTKDERVKQVFGVKLEIQNEEGILKPGMPADAIIEYNL
jgi:HlyD family secretion protein